MSMFTIRLECLEEGKPAAAASGWGEDSADEDSFARALLGTILAMRAQESVWGNGESFGGSDPVETAARLLVLVAERETGPGGLWHFAPGQAESEGYAERLAQINAAATAAKTFIRGPK